jgi:molybdenum cofactor biosynthesis enzyme
VAVLAAQHQPAVLLVQLILAVAAVVAVAQLLGVMAVRELSLFVMLVQPNVLQAAQLPLLVDTSSIHLQLAVHIQLN